MTELEHKNLSVKSYESHIFLPKTPKDEEQKHINELIKNGVEEGLQVPVKEVLSLTYELFNLPAPYLAIYKKNKAARM
jgi:hypothetical protein